MKKKVLSVVLALTVAMSTSPAFASITGIQTEITSNNTSSNTSFQTGSWDSSRNAFRSLTGYGGAFKTIKGQTTYYPIGNNGENKLNENTEFSGTDKDLNVVAFDLKKSRGLEEVGIGINNVSYTSEDGTSKLIDIRITCTNYQDGPDKRTTKGECIQFLKSPYPVIWISGVTRANIKYSFYKAGTGATEKIPVSVKSNFTITDIDDSEGVAFINANSSNVVVSSGTLLDRRSYKGHPCVLGPKASNYADNEQRISASLNFNTNCVSLAYLDGKPCTTSNNGPATTETGQLTGRQYHKGLKSEMNHTPEEERYHRTGWFNGEAGDNANSFLAMSGTVSLVGDEKYATTIPFKVEMAEGIYKDVTRKYYKGRFVKKAEGIDDVRWDNFRNRYDQAAAGYNAEKWSQSTGRKPIPNTREKATGNGYIAYREDYEGRTPVVEKRIELYGAFYSVGETFSRQDTSERITHDWQFHRNVNNEGSELLDSSSKTYGHKIIEKKVYKSKGKYRKAYRYAYVKDYRLETTGGNIIRATKHWKEPENKYATLSFYYESWVKHIPAGNKYWLEVAKFSAGKHYVAPAAMKTPIVYNMKHSVTSNGIDISADFKDEDAGDTLIDNYRLYYNGQEVDSGSKSHSSNTGSHLFTYRNYGAGNYQVKWEVRDKAGHIGYGEYDFYISSSGGSTGGGSTGGGTVTPSNNPPYITNMNLIGDTVSATGIDNNSGDTIDMYYELFKDGAFIERGTTQHFNSNYGDMNFNGNRGAGNYTVKWYVTDNHGLTGTDTYTYVIANSTQPSPFNEAPTIIDMKKDANNEIFATGIDKNINDTIEVTYTVKKDGVVLKDLENIKSSFNNNKGTVHFYGNRGAGNYEVYWNVIDNHGATGNGTFTYVIGNEPNPSPNPNPNPPKPNPDNDDDFKPIKIGFNTFDSYPRFISKEYLWTLNADSRWVTNSAYKTQLENVLNNNAPIESFALKDRVVNRFIKAVEDIGKAATQKERAEAIKKATVLEKSLGQKYRKYVSADVFSSLEAYKRNI